MFHFERDDQGLTVRVTGDAVEALDSIAETLELNVRWPVIPLALDCLNKVAMAHSDTDEKLRDVVMLDNDESQGMFLFDIEAMKVEAKKMEIQGLRNPDNE
ncbi:MAG: hypothetical protein ACXABY_06175 [Candidatus Thorarchaeota archaeon]|jgi:hypothetical protein